MLNQSQNNAVPPLRFLRLPEVMVRVGLSKMTIYRKERDGSFPRRRKIAEQAVAWVEAEINDWCAKRAAGEPWVDEQ